ncbi:MAG: hypothetical protein EBS77_03900 [Gammaproteobacteria bacterium]|nr:hypothetical protein [Gammaproteobacteria bacterium]
MDAIGPKSSFDFSGMGALKAEAAQQPNSEAAIGKAAKQFEALFIQMMLKSMRDATPKGGLFDSESTKTFEQMYDTQIAMALSERGDTGLSEMVANSIRQLQDASAASDLKKFALGKLQGDPLRLVNESDRFPISEGSTQQFLLQRRGLNLGGSN